MTNDKFNHLLMELKCGHKSAFDEIYKEYFGKMRFVAARMLHNEADVYDAVQTAFLNLLKYINTENYTKIKYPGGFMYNLIKNATLNLIKSNKRYLPMEENEHIIDTKYDETAALGALDISSAIASLPSKDREIAIRIFMFKVPVKKVAEEMNMSVSAVKWHKNQIRKFVFNKIKK